MRLPKVPELLSGREFGRLLPGLIPKTLRERRHSSSLLGRALVFLAEQPGIHSLRTISGTSTGADVLRAVAADAPLSQTASGHPESFG